MNRSLWVLRAVCVLSLLVFIATVGFAIRAEFAVDKCDVFVLGRHVYVGSFKRHIYAELDTERFKDWRAWYWTVVMPLGTEDRFLGVRAGRTNSGSLFVGLPHWLILLLSAPLPAWWLFSARSRRRRVARGECLKCGYYLRASPDRCPECGTAVPNLIK